MAHKDRPHLPGKRRQISDTDADTLYHTFDAQAGSYSSSGSILLRQPVVVKNPRDKGCEIKVQFTIDNDLLATLIDRNERIWQRIR
jgi:hypothetical protein